MADDVGGKVVRITDLPAMRVASFHGFGADPEMEAWGKLQAWAEPIGLLNDENGHRIFGFNNPDPSVGSPNYGYEFWIQLDGSEPVGNVVREYNFAGGAYAVLRVAVMDDAYEVIPSGWKRLHALCEEAGLRFSGHQWLEEHITEPDTDGGFVLDLYMPIVK